jgi:2-polyprenyl-6-methoxyphenol hydroxylase-like FAD-dependent oxidoreductase
MNTGMQDACNLGWKLALVSRGICEPEPLLSSYSAERSAIAKLVLDATGKATAMSVMKGGSDPNGPLFTKPDKMVDDIRHSDF